MSGSFSNFFIDLLTFREENYGRKKALLCDGGLNSTFSLYFLIFSSTNALSDGIGFLAVSSDSQLCDLSSGFCSLIASCRYLSRRSKGILIKIFFLDYVDFLRWGLITSFCLYCFNSFVVRSRSYFNFLITECKWVIVSFSLSSSSRDWALTLIFLALSANFKDDTVSWINLSDDEQLTIIEVRKLPVRESLSSLVSLEFLKGMC